MTVDQTGEVINERYALLEIVGRGGQGLVYRGFDRWTERAVAVKLLGSGAAKQQETAERLLREQQAMAVLKGTAAVELLDVCRGNRGELCLVMELLSGTDLEEFLYTIEEQGERLSLERVAEIFDPVVKTLALAHEAGIVHRDLKPANVFLLEGGGVKLLDFGLARVRSAAPLTAAGTVMGSPSYIAPEVWKGDSSLLDHRVDVYSLGVILFRVISGKLPFVGETLHEKFLGSTKSERPSLHALRPDLPARVDDWVEMALAIDREARFRNVTAMWEAFLHTFGVSPPGRRPSLWAAAKHMVRRLARDDVSPRPAAPEAEPSLLRKALLGSVPPPNDERTVLGWPPSADSSRGASPRPAAERTLELSSSEFEDAPPSRDGGRTLELSAGDMVAIEAGPPPPPPRAARVAPAGDEVTPEPKPKKARKKKRPKKARKKKKPKTRKGKR